jgi:hypothetical protein
VSSIYVKTLLEALDRPSTMKSLTRKTGYSVQQVLRTILEARAIGHTIRAVSRGKYRDAEPTYYEVIK